MRGNDRQVCWNSENISERPSLKEIESNVHVRVKERLKGNKTLLYVLRAIPIITHSGSTLGDPLLEADLHCFNSLPDFVVCSVDDIVEEELWDKSKEFW